MGDDTMCGFIVRSVAPAVLGIALVGPSLDLSIAQSLHPTQNPKNEQTVQGKLQSVDPVKNTFILVPEGGTAMVVELTDQTRIRIGEKAGTREDLKAGQKVKCVHTTREGKHVCESLSVELTK
jgi:hypothetical protein